MKSKPSKKSKLNRLSRVPKDPARWNYKSPGKLSLTIITGPNTDGGSLSLAHDVDLVRASLLYADEIELISVNAVMMAGFLNLASSDGNMLDLLGTLDDETIAQITGDRPLPANWRALLSTLSAMSNTSTLEELGVSTHGLRAPMAELRRSADEMFSQSGGESLLPAINSGIVKLSSSGFTAEGDLDAALERWLALLKERLEDPQTRVLLDDQVGSLARAMVDEGRIEMDTLHLRHGREAVAGSGFIARLPAFPQAPTDELIDLRKDLRGPLIRYRRAVSSFSEMLRFRSFDRESSTEVDDLYMREVQPEILRLQEEFADHQLVREISRTLGADIRTVATLGAGAFIGVAVDQFTSVSNWVATAFGAAGVAGQSVIAAAESRRRARKELKQAELFYLYEVNRNFLNR
ncbi:hypothetical protein [Actinophytocola sp. NPDC049390]|uniref:hypothetical protein n=1 Tax=Actinophytocola sp. NPDC049390 TaxID=3363894 RepID=UPI0037893ADD